MKVGPARGKTLNFEEVAHVLKIGLLDLQKLASRGVFPAWELVVNDWNAWTERSVLAWIAKQPQRI